MRKDVRIEQDAERADAVAAREQNPAASLVRRLLLRVKGRDAHQRQHVDCRERLARGRRDITKDLRRVARRGADDDRRPAIELCGRVQADAHVARAQAARHRVDQLLHPAGRRDDTLLRDARRLLSRPEQE